MTDSRRALLQAAAEEFARHGLKGARIQSIVQRAGVNERMIYHHFGSKEGLYIAAVEDQRLGMGAELAAALKDAATLPPYDGMRRALAALYDAVRARPLLGGLITHELLSGMRVAPFPSAALLPAEMRTLYQQGQVDGSFPADVPFESAYVTAISGLVGIASLGERFADELGLKLAEFREQAISQIIDGMTGPPGRHHLSSRARKTPPAS